MNISLNPTYLCNLRCDFCYLGEKLGDKTRIDLGVLDSRLDEICRHKEIETLDLYGGEITILPNDYLNDLFLVIKKHYQGPVNIITNLTVMSDVLLREDVDVSVSFDFEARTGFEKTLRNLALMPRHVSVLMLASKKFLEIDVGYMISVLNGLQSVQAVEIKPYSTNQYNQQAVSFKDYESLVQKFITHPIQLRPQFVNELYIQDSLAGTRNAFSDNHIYITPSGKFGVLEFDKNDDEFFLELDSYEDYLRWVQIEKLRVRSNPICSTCQYFGKCLTEHYRNVVNIENSCNGFRYLLDWYKDAGMETTSENLPRD
jgi:molybdenum cofactor biosynthesis enzyme MoaA